ncbi:hypothetical protein [Fructobacillus durionis]|uniref:Uncharacterized protein n=1 Tax=Fructobacillus durionis TaxID=283737 RepID=A0A1I1GFF4_9LACO|nr:hypothetical protein [Fructobacillus durionis]SFC10135.1 hypothetical protein SAMN05660453_1057 [Fructobacillus durionis]
MTKVLVKNMKSLNNEQLESVYGGGFFFDFGYHSGRAAHALLTNKIPHRKYT